MKITCKRGKTLTVDQITTGELFRYNSSYYMRCLFITESRTRLYWSVDLFTGEIKKNIPDDTLVEVFDESEVLIK